MAFCSNCGNQISDQSSACPVCGHPTGVAQQLPVQTVPNYLVQAILTTLFCCLPLGIVSIVFATQVNSKLSVGDVAGAIDASNKAKMWAWISFGLGLAVIATSFVFRAGRL